MSQNPGNQNILAQVSQLYSAGKLREVIAVVDKSVVGLFRFQPVHAELLNFAGSAARQLGDAARAERYFRQAVNINPRAAHAFCNLGLLKLQVGDLAAAEPALRQTLALEPAHALAGNALGVLLHRQARFSEAEATFRDTVTRNPKVPGAWNNFANLLRDQGKYADAENAYRQALALDRRQLESLANLGQLYMQCDRPTEAEQVLREALTLAPQQRNILADWIKARRILCDWTGLDQAERTLSRLLTQPAPGFVPPFTALALNSMTAPLQKVVSELFVLANLAHVIAPPPLVARQPAPKERLRIGYLSSDFEEHATMWLLGGVLTHHDREAVEIYIYSYGPTKPGAQQELARANCTRFTDIGPLPDAEAAARIAADDIDILVDLKGYTAGSRPAIAALRPAPVLVSWLGYPGTLGHPRLADYIIGDATVTPLEHAAHFSETIAQLPHCYQPNNNRNAIGATPTRAEAGLPDTGFVFCNFNQSYKTTPERFALWCRLLAAVPGSVLWQLAPTQLAAIENLQREAQSHGIDPARLIMAPNRSHADHLGRLQLADLALDPFPCTSHTTASDALWAGVPLLTQLGETFASRVPASILRALDLPELVVESEADYEALALALATDPERLAALRAKIITNRSGAPLFDTEVFTRDLEKLYRRIWEQECQGQREAIGADSVLR